MNLGEAKGDWALVTGASSGLGRAFARQLAAAGLNVVLAARDRERLREVEWDLAADFDVRKLAVAADLSRPEGLDELEAQLRAAGIRIRVLCNNAAIGFWGRFEDAEAGLYGRMAATNVLALTELAARFFADLASHPSSAVINVASSAAHQPVPYMAMYAATKAFVHSFSQALQEEWAPHGIRVQTLLPGPMPTGLPGCDALGPPAQTPEEVARISLKCLRRGKPVVETEWQAPLQRLFMALCPSTWKLRMVGRMFNPSARRAEAARETPERPSLQGAAK